MMAANGRQFGGTHYKELEIQPWDAIEAWQLGFLDGNVVKYVARWKKKGNGLLDLMKARHYLDKLIEIESEKIPTLNNAMKPEVGDGKSASQDFGVPGVDRRRNQPDEHSETKGDGVGRALQSLTQS